MTSQWKNIHVDATQSFHIRVKIGLTPNTPQGYIKLAISPNLFALLLTLGRFNQT
jgi:hypothetical protein